MHSATIADCCCCPDPLTRMQGDALWRRAEDGPNVLELVQGHPCGLGQRGEVPGRKEPYTHKGTHIGDDVSATGLPHPPLPPTLPG